MRRPEHELDFGSLPAGDVHWRAELLGQNKRRYKTDSSLPGTQTKCTMCCFKSIETTRKSPPSAFHHLHLHPSSRSTSTAIRKFVTLSLALVLFYVAFASRFTTISGAETSAQHRHHDRHQHNHLGDHEHNSYLNSRNHKVPRHLDIENNIHGSVSYEPPNSRSLRIKHLQEQRRLRNLIAKTSSTSKLLRDHQHKRAIADVHDESPSHQHQQQQLPSSAVQNLHNRRRYHFYDNEIHYPNARRHFDGGAPRLGAHLKTTTTTTTATDQIAHDFSMHDDSKFWNDLGQDQNGDEFGDVDSLDVDLYEDDDDVDDEEEDDDEDVENRNDDEDENVDERRVPNENLRISHAKHPWKGFNNHWGEHHSKTRYHTKHPGHREQESSPMIARPHLNEIQHDDHSGSSELHARNKKPWLHHNRHHVHGQPVQLATAEKHQQRISQVPYQSPVVVSISDNSFVSASPPVLVGLDTNRGEQQRRLQHKELNAIDAIAANEDAPDGFRPTTMNIATTSIDDDDSLERDHVLANNISGSVTGSLLNITTYNRVETSTRKNMLISDHDDGVSRHRKVHLLQPLASGDTFNNFMDNSIRYSRIAPPSLRPIGEDAGVYTTHADQIGHQHKKQDRTGSHLVINSRHVRPQLATNGHTTYMYELELTATTTPRTSAPTSSDVAAYKTEEDKDTNDDNVDGDEADQDDDDDDDDIDPDEDDGNSLTIDSFQLVHPKSKDSNVPARYSHIIASPNNELPSYGRKYWHTPHRASIQLVQEEPNGFHRASINSAIIAILFGIGAMGMLIMIVSIKMGSIRERVAYKGRRRSLVPDTDFLINTIPI